MLVSKLDTIIEFRTSSTLQLYVKQDRVLEKDVADYLNAQRSLAPRALELIQSIDIEKPQDSSRVLTEVLAVYRTVDTDFRQVLVKHLLTLDKEQRKAFYEKLKEQNQELFEKLKKDRTDLYQERMQFFIGDLTEAQQKLLRPHEQVFLERDRQRLVKREAFQADIKMILEATKDPQRAEKLRARFLQHQQDTFSNTAHVEAFLKDLLPSLNKEQKQHFQEKKLEVLEMVQQFAVTKYE